MQVFAVDPGSEHSAFVLFDGQEVCRHGILPNADLVVELNRVSPRVSALVIEQMVNYGMSVGQAVFETVFWTGRFVQAWGANNWTRLTRPDIKLHLCGQVRANDAAVRWALIDRFGGKEKAIGNSRKPGPLHGVVKDEWSALAVAVTFWDQQHLSDAVKSIEIRKAHAALRKVT